MKKANKKLRIYWNSNAPWSTSGYGTQSAELLPQFAKEGYPTACGCFYGLEGGRIEVDGVTMYPKMAETWGTDGMVHHANHFKADVTFSFQDIWPMDASLLPQIRRWIPYVPIDHEPVPRAIFDRLKLAYRIVTYSQFGQKELKRLGLHSTYIPHTVDTTVFKPIDKAEARKALGIPEDLFLFGMVAANKDNPPRKSFQEAMDAFDLFRKAHPELKAAMFFHTNVSQAGGFDIPAYATYLGIADRIYYPNLYQLLFDTSRDILAKIYNCFDVLLAPSLNEGFGIPIIEAQACGVPAIVNNWTSMPELVIPGETGEVCEIATKRFSPLNSYTAVPDTKSLYECMEKIYKADRAVMAQKSAQWAKDNYDTAKIVKEQWLPFLQRLEDEIYPTAEVDNKPSSK